MRAACLSFARVACLALVGASGSSLDSSGHAVFLHPPAESTDDILQGLARDVSPGMGSSGTVAAMIGYEAARQRMLDAEEVAIKRIVRESLAPLLADRRGD